LNHVDACGGCRSAVVGHAEMLGRGWTPMEECVRGAGATRPARKELGCDWHMLAVCLRLFRVGPAFRNTELGNTQVEPISKAGSL
jgi:hypothetical protein